MGLIPPHTLSAYKRDLTIYKQFSGESRDISFFYEYIDKQGLSSRSKSRVISSVRSYFRFLEQRGHKTPLKKLSPIPVKTKLPRLVSLTEFEKIQKSAVVSDIHRTARNRVFLLLLFGLGCRVSEITGLRLKDLNAMDQALVVTGKRKKQRLLPLTVDMFQSIHQYVWEHRPCLISPPDKGALLVNNRGHKLTRIDAWRWLSHWSKKAGLPGVKGPHQFRHGFATTLLENGADLRSIQFLLGHSSIQTTQIYTSVKNAHLKKTIREHHPLSGVTLKKGIPFIMNIIKKILWTGCLMTLSFWVYAEMPSWFLSSGLARQKWGLFPHISRNDTYGYMGGVQFNIYPMRKNGYYTSLNTVVSENSFFFTDLNYQWLTSSYQWNIKAAYNGFDDVYYGEGSQTLVTRKKYISSHKVVLNTEYLIHITQAFLAGGFTGAYYRQETGEQPQFPLEISVPVGLMIRYDTRSHPLNPLHGEFYELRAWLLAQRYSPLFIEGDMRFFFPVFEDLVLGSEGKSRHNHASK